MKLNLKIIKNKIIRNIVDNDVDKNNTPGILSSFRSFYKTLYSCENIDLSLKDTFLNDLPQVSEENNFKLSTLISESEILHALKQMDHTKTPGSDGITSLFYLTFFLSPAYEIGRGILKWRCPSVLPSVRPSVRPSVLPSVTCVFSVTSQ